MSSIQSSPGFSGEDEQHLQDFSSTGDYDPDYECDAPKYVNFSQVSQQHLQKTPASSDEWFDKQVDTPFSERQYEIDPIYDPLEDLDKTPTAKYPDDSSEFLDENTPTPKPKKYSDSSSSSFQSTVSEQQAEDEEMAQLSSQFNNLRAKPFTPVRPSKLVQSTTWADIESSPEIKQQFEKIQDQRQSIQILSPQPPTPPMQHLLKAKSFVPSRSTKPLTVPIEFNFSQRKPMPQANAKKNGVDATTSDAKQKPRIANKSGSTIPKPFKFHSLSVKSEPKQTENSPFVPLVLRVKEFDKTPDRFKPLPKDARLPSSKPTERKITKAVTPKLLTNLRVRKTRSIPSEEKELQELKQAGFKARPIDLRILQSHGDLGVPRVKKAPVTIPYSPKISKSRPRSIAVEEPEQTIRARPYAPPKPFHIKIEHREIKPDDFKLPGDDISLKKKQQFLEDMKKEEESKKVEFKAQPVNLNPRPPLLPQSHITDPKSPALLTKVRGRHYQEVFKDKIEKEGLEFKKQSEFKAHPVPDLDQVFIPKPSDRPLTDIEELVLNTEIRSGERRQFDMFIKEQEELQEKLKAQQQLEKQLEEQEEIRKIRKQAEFKAQPIMKTLPFEAKKSDKPLTEPLSPFIGDKRRLFKEE